MQPQDLANHPIMRQVRRAIALNRSPGWHFGGNFIDVIFNKVHGVDAILTVPAAQHNLDSEGHLSVAMVAMLADMGLGNAVRASLDPASRLATVSISLQFNGVTCTGDIEAVGKGRGFVQGIGGLQGLSDCVITCNDQLICIGLGSFMIMPPPPGVELHPIPWIKAPAPVDPPLDLDSLNEKERWILHHAEHTLQTSLANGEDFISHFLGFLPTPGERSAYCELINGPHIGNRVGHFQGGIVLAFGMTTAEAALNKDWVMTGATASYISPGQGATISARSVVLHQGRSTAVVKTEVLNVDGRQVLEVLTNHSRRA